MEKHTEHIEEFVEGYALGVLDQTEREQVARHVAECPPCQQKIAVAEDAANMLALLAAPAAPPLRCKQWVLERIEREQFLARPTRTSRSRVPLTRWATLAALVLFLVTGGWSVYLQQQLTRASATLAQTQAELASMRTQIAQTAAFDQTLVEGAVRRDLQGEGPAAQAKGLVSMTPGQNKAAVIIAGLPPLPPGRQYQLWVARPGMQEPLEAFTTTNGPVRLEIAPSEPMDKYERIIITVEPAPDTQKPMGQPVLRGDL